MLKPKSLIAASCCVLIACSPREAKKDSAFADLQRRGQSVMGVDQYISNHVFEDLPDGGRIVLDREDAADTAAIRTIRAHMRDIAGSFQRGDFAAPGLVHAKEVPGTRVMARMRSEISYTFADRPRGGEVRMLASDPEALAAIRAFLNFQRSEHRAPAHENR